MLTQQNEEAWIAPLVQGAAKRAPDVDTDDLFQEARLAIWAARSSSPDMHITVLYAKVQSALLAYIFYQSQALDSSESQWAALTPPPSSSSPTTGYEFECPELEYQLKQAFERSSLLMKESVALAFDLTLQGYTLVEISNYFNVAPIMVCGWLAEAHRVISRFTTFTIPDDNANSVADVAKIWLTQIQRTHRQTPTPT